MSHLQFPASLPLSLCLNTISKFLLQFLPLSQRLFRPLLPLAFYVGLLRQHFPCAQNHHIVFAFCLIFIAIFSSSPLSFFA